MIDPDCMRISPREYPGLPKSFAAAVASSIATFDQMGELPPVWNAYGDNGVMASFIATLDEDRDETLTAIRRLFEKLGVHSYSVAAEAWIAVYDTKVSDMTVMPRDREDRREGIVIVAVDINDESYGAWVPIIRDENGAHCGKPEQLPGEASDGSLLGMLRRGS